LIQEWSARHAGSLTRFVFIERKVNAGLCASLNELVGAAQGEIIHILASDDYYLPGGLAAKTRVLLEHPDWDGTFCDAQAVGWEGQLYGPSLLAEGRINPARLSPEHMAEELLYHWDASASLLSWRRRFFKAHGGEFEYDVTVFCEDFDSAWQAMSKKALGFAPVVCQAYRCRSWPQTSNRNLIREHRDIAHVLVKYARHFEQPIQEGMRNLAAALFHSAAGDVEGAAKYCQDFGEAALRYESRVHGMDQRGVASPSKPDTEEVAALRSELADAGRRLEKAKDSHRRESSKQKDAISHLEHLLRYHSANPLRALKLWWSRASKAKE
jgi:hypothetical protein